MKKLKMILGFLKGNKLLYSMAIGAVILASLLAYTQPLIMRYGIDTAIGGQPAEVPQIAQNFINKAGGDDFFKANIWVLGLMMICLTIVSGSFQYLKGRWSALASESIANKLRNRLYKQLQGLPYMYHTKAETGDLIQRCTSDVDTIRRFFAMQFVQLGNTIFMIAMAAPIMYSLSPSMTGVSLGAVPFLVAFSAVFFIWMRSAFKKADVAEGKLSNVLQENISGVRVVRAFARQKTEIDKFEEKNEIYRSNNYSYIKLLARYWAITDWICLIQLASVIVYGVTLAAQGTISLGTFMVFISYVGMFLWPVRQLGRIIADLGQTTVAAERISEILHLAPEDLGKEESARWCGDISFKEVHFSYDGKTDIIKGISFDVKAGQTVAILGKTGSGKSTLMKLLPRLIDYSAGSIKIAGKELNTLGKHLVRQNVGIVLQEPFLFSKTIKDNISLAAKSASDEQIFHSAEMASVHTAINEFENGYETAVGEKGVTLSGGQKQRVAIARSLINDHPILIFDDSLSAVDAETDAKIREQLIKSHHRATVFIIAHRISTLMKADMILVLDDGHLVQKGTHAELLAADGLYKRISLIQNIIETDNVSQSA